MLSPDLQAEILSRYFSEKQSLRKIAKTLGLNRKSVTACIARRRIDKSRPAQQPRPSMLDPLKPVIMDLFDLDPDIHASTILYKLRGLGFNGGYSTLRDWLRKNRPKDLRASPKEAFLSINFENGDCAQVDWGEFNDVFHDGVKIHCFVMVLCYSRYLYIEFTRGEKFEDFVRCHERAFAFFGGRRPTEIWYDNLATAVSERRGKLVRFNSRFYAYCGHQGFSPHACNVASGNEKGRVEDGVKYIRSSFWSGRRFENFRDLECQARVWLTEIANRREHRATKKIPELVFQNLEREKLKPVHPDPYDCDEVISKTLFKDFHLTYQTNRYSVPWTLVGHILTMRINDTEVKIYYANKLVASHERLYLKDQKTTKPHHEDSLRDMKPGSRDSSWQVTTLEAMGEDIKRYLSFLKNSPRSLNWELKKMMALSTVYGPDELTRAVKMLLGRSQIGADQLETILKRTSIIERKPEPLELKNDRLNQASLPIDFKRYEQFILSKPESSE